MLSILKHIHPFQHPNIPTYYNPVLEFKHDEDNKPITRVRGTGGGDKVVYTFGNTSQVAVLLLLILLHSSP